MQLGIPGKDDDDSESPYLPIGSFDRRIIESLSAQIAILDKRGIIRETAGPGKNSAWKTIFREMLARGD